MSFNLENIGIPIAMILTDTKKETIVSLDNTEKAKNKVSDIQLTNENQRFQVVGDPKRERDIIYITGRSGSGKSYFMKDYVNNYYKVMFKKRPIYLFWCLDYFT